MLTSDEKHYYVVKSVNKLHYYIVKNVNMIHFYVGKNVTGWAENLALCADLN